MTKNFASRVAKAANSGLDDLLVASEQSNLISFAGGYPDKSLFPTNQLNTAIAHTFAEGDLDLLQYSGTEGLPAIRQKIAQRMHRAGVHVDWQHVMMTQGAQQGLDLTARLLINKGDGLIVEAPTYIGALAAFNAYEPTYYEVPMTADGMDMAVLEQTLQNHAVKMIYTVPDFQNPTGAVMSLKKRKQLIALANLYDVIILEDAPYRDLRYSGVNLPPVKALDTQGRVIYLGSFSKILAPGLRLGWLCASPELFEQLVGLKNGSDLQSSNLMIAGVNQYLTENDLGAHIETIRRVYRQKKDAMYQALEQYMPTSAQFNNPDGGFFIWLQMPETINLDQLMRNLLVPAAHVAFVPSTHLFATSTVTNCARLNFTGPTLEQIDTGIRHLGELLCAVDQPQAVISQV